MLHVVQALAPSFVALVANKRVSVCGTRKIVIYFGVKGRRDNESDLHAHSAFEFCETSMPEQPNKHEQDDLIDGHGSPCAFGPCACELRLRTLSPAAIAEIIENAHSMLSRVVHPDKVFLKQMAIDYCSQKVLTCNNCCFFHCKIGWVPTRGISHYVPRAVGRRALTTSLKVKGQFVQSACAYEERSNQSQNPLITQLFRCTLFVFFPSSTPWFCSSTLRHGSRTLPIDSEAKRRQQPSRSWLALTDLGTAGGRQELCSQRQRLRKWSGGEDANKL